MLKLKKLQILGFKSFCDRTELKFHGDGIAAIVGPNGCGKSNIADAISWVLGEQSAKSLRGARMEDVIFAGTRDRKPLGMAEVSLTLVEPEIYGSDPGEPEIEIHDQLPEEDWDEASLRSSAETEAERHIEEVRPLPPEEVLVTNPAAAAAGDQPPAAAAAEASAADGENHADEQAAHHGGNEVVLKIRRRKFKPTVFRAGEVMVTRRLFRSGESEYLLNGKLCRLRDIQDIFMGTGLGPESYAIIEQGRIGQILSSKPHDRRAIIEEAAGITKFKTKKRLAEARLEQAKQNLSRVNDIFDEVTRQMNSLKRQAAKAERYAKLRDEMRAKLRVVLASKFRQLDAELARLDEDYAAVAEEMRVRGEAVEAMDLEHTDRTQRGYSLENEAKQNRQRQSEIALEADRSSARQRTNEERCAELVARSVAAEAELARTVAQQETLEAELANNRAILESAAADLAGAQQEAEQRRQDAGSANAVLATVEREQELRRSALLQALSAASHTRNQITQAEENIASLDRESQRIERELGTARSEIDAMGASRGQLGLEFESVSQRAGALQERISDVRLQIEAKRAAETEAKRGLDSLRAEYATALGKKSSLESVIAEHGYSTESVKRLFQSGAVERGFTPAGVLADFLEVEDRYESVVEDFLRDELNFIVVKSWDSADQGLDLLRTDMSGRATFLVHPNDSQAKFSFAFDEGRRPATHADAVVPLKNCIRVLNGFGKSLEVILPKLGDGYITPDARTARELALENPDAYFLAPTGETFRNVTVTGGKQRSEGPLSMKRELRDVLRVLQQLEDALRAGEARVQTLGRELGELTSLLQRLEEERRETDQKVMASSHALKQMEAELARTEQRLNTYRVELERLKTQRADKEAAISERRESLSAQEQARQHIETEMAAAQERLAELKSARDAAAQASAEAAARAAMLEERRRSAAASLQRIESMVHEVQSRTTALRDQMASAAAEKQQREAENANIAERLVTLAAEREQAELRAGELQAESEQVRARVAEIELELKAARAALDAARDRRGEIAAAAAKLRSDVEHMGETCLNDLGIPADVLRADQEIALVEGEQLGMEDQAYREMRTRLDAMGPVNMMALEEYQETAQRHAFLETQRKDLLESIENTQNTIKEIDVFSRQKFDEAFARINENFQVTFKKLFGGGHAFMRLTDEENTAESGIDVVASPPGKKLQNVLLLSGGEKALTAFSLLVGIFQYQPSPFCILDEVDAPLDEANIGRFTDLIREMSSQTQFVIITHSKKTMSIAPVMYGVTMQEPGASKIVSVKFGEERREPGRAATA